MDAKPIILAQLAPGATVETVLYLVPETEHARIAEIIVCNRLPGIASFRISISLRSAVTATKDYLYYDCPIAGNDTFAADMDLTLGPLDVIRVYTDSASLTFTLFGEKT